MAEQTNERTNKQTPSILEALPACLKTVWLFVDGSSHYENSVMMKDAIESIPVASVTSLAAASNTGNLLLAMATFFE